MNGNTMKSEDILTPEQLAERLQVGVNWVYEKSRSRGAHNAKPLWPLSEVLLARSLRMAALRSEAAGRSKRDEGLFPSMREGSCLRDVR
jgi:hypothetical protein